MTDRTVYMLLNGGSSLEQIIVALADEKAKLMQRVLELSQIAPHKIKTPDGKVLVWHCPDEFVPFIK